LKEYQYHAWYAHCKSEWCEKYGSTFSRNPVTKAYSKHYHHYYNERGQKIYFCSNRRKCERKSNSKEWQEITFSSIEKLLYHFETAHKKNPKTKKKERKHKKLIKKNEELRRENEKLMKINKTIKDKGEALIKKITQAPDDSINADSEANEYVNGQAVYRLYRTLKKKSSQEPDYTNKYFCNVTNKYFCNVKGCPSEGFREIKRLYKHIRRIHESDRYFCPIIECYNSGSPFAGYINEIQLVNKHLIKAHSTLNAVGWYSCNIDGCSFSITKKIKNLRKHMKRAHKGIVLKQNAQELISDRSSNSSNELSQSSSDTASHYGEGVLSFSEIFPSGSSISSEYENQESLSENGSNQNEDVQSLSEIFTEGLNM